MLCLGWEVPHQAGSNVVCGGGANSVEAPQQGECSQALQRPFLVNCRLPEQREQVLLCCLHICEVALATSLSATERKAQNRAGFKLFSFSPQRFRHPFTEKRDFCELWSRGSLDFSERVPQSLWKLLGALGLFKAQLFIFSDHIEHWLFLGIAVGV